MFSKTPKTSISNFKFKKVTKDEVPQKDIQPILKPWEKLDWSKEKEQGMYLEWGVHCSRKQDPDRAEGYYNQAISLRESDARVLFQLSRCQRQVAKNESAFENSKKAVYFDPHNPKVDLEYCRCLYQMNQFEVANTKYFNMARKYVGSECDSFKRMSETLDLHVKDCTGMPYNEFISKRTRILPDVLEAHQKKTFHDPRPLWKVLKEQEKCDIFSVLEKERELLHPREIARRKLASRIYHQVYLPHSWEDALYQRTLEEDDQYLSSVFKESTPVLRNILKSKNEAVSKFLKMLHTRSPLYHKFSYRLKSKKLTDLMHENHLNRVQYATRRNMINILRTIKYYRQKGALDKLTEFVEKYMGDYISVTTKRVAPWKNEFLKEVYNTLALAFTDKCVIPPALVENLDINSLEKLFGIEPAKENLKPIGFVFGDKSTQIDSSSNNLAHEKKRKFLNRMEKRLFFATDIIERAYIYHEMARAHYKTGNFGECEFVASKGVKEATQNNNNLIWAFLCTLLIVKSNICTKRREKCADALEAAGNLAYQLRSSKLLDFVEQAKQFNIFKMSSFKTSETSDSKKTRSRTFSSDQISINSRSNLKAQFEDQPDEIF